MVDLSPHSSPQSSQRVKVGAIGLAIVVMLIVLASALMGSATRQGGRTAPGGAKPDIVANIALGNLAGVEPGTDMAISPGPQNGSVPTH